MEPQVGSHITVVATCAGCGKPIYSIYAYWVVEELSFHGLKCYNMLPKKTEEQ